MAIDINTLKNSEKIRISYQNFLASELPGNENIYREWKKDCEDLKREFKVSFFTALLNPEKRLKNNPEYKTRYDELLDKYNARGFYPQVTAEIAFLRNSNAKCGDYDPVSECFVCSVDGSMLYGREIDFCQCRRCVECQKLLKALAPDDWYWKEWQRTHNNG